MEISIYKQHFILSPEKALFWKERDMLVIADAHFSKEMHFRKNGIAVPGDILQKDLQRLDTLIQLFQPKQLLFLGDMFHSDANEGLSEFMGWRKRHHIMDIQLIIGNHDVLHRDWYHFADIHCVEELLITENILWSHDRIVTENSDLINICGHIHPYIRLLGMAKQTLRLQCFWCAENFAIMPAFGRFTGGRVIHPSKRDKIFAAAENEIIEVTERLYRN